MTDRTAKEIVYDEQIAPIMTEVLRLCFEHGISVLAVFDIAGPEDEQLVVTSQLPDKTGKYSALIEANHRFLKGEAEPLDRPNPGTTDTSTLKRPKDH